MAALNSYPESSSKAGRAREVLASKLLPAMFVALFAVQCAWFIGTQSLTLDEPANSLVGREAWLHGQLKEHDDNPPLGRLWLSLLILGDQWQVTKDGYHSIQSIQPSPEALAWRARSMSVVLGLLLGWLVWNVCRHFWGIRGAQLGLGLWAISPCLLAHFSVANLDGASALMTFAVVWQVIRVRNHPAWGRVVLLGMLLGAYLATKHSAAPMAALAVLLILVMGPARNLIRPRQWAWWRTACVLGVASLVVWGAYLFHVSHLRVEQGRMTLTFPNTELRLQKELPWKISFQAYVPAAEYFTGMANVIENSRRGYGTSVLGEFYEGGRWYYFPVVVALKWPTLVLLLAAGTLVAAAVGHSRLPTDMKLMLLFPAAYFLLAMASNMNLGDRHILPVYPFLLVFAAGATHLPWLEKRWRAGLLLLVSFQAVDTLRYAPDYYSYFMPLVNPSESYRLLAGGNLDGGQGLLALRKYEQEHPEERIYLYYVGSVHPEAYGIRAERVQDGVRPRGTVVVSARALGGRAVDDPRSWSWILRYRRKAILNHTLHMFEVPEEAPGSMAR